MQRLQQMKEAFVKKGWDKLADKEPKVVIVADLDEAASEARLLQAAARRARLGSEFVLANEDAHVSKVELDCSGS